MIPPDGILETILYARDIAAAERFYADVIGLPVQLCLPERFVFLVCGQQMLLIFNPDHSRRNDPALGVPRHGAEGAGHVCFRARDRADLEAWRAHFIAAGIPIESVHVWSGGHLSLYVRDPAGNSVELAEPALWGLG